MLRKFAKCLSAVSAFGLIGFIVAPAALADTYNLIGCTAVPYYSGAKICFYYDAANNHYGRGQLINNSSSNISNDGIFVQTNGNVGYACSSGQYTTTYAGTTSTCTKPLDSHIWQLTDRYKYNGNVYDVSTVSHQFR